MPNGKGIVKNNIPHGVPYQIKSLQKISWKYCDQVKAFYLFIQSLILTSLIMYNAPTQ